jgi:hypothetical protein
MFVVVVIVATFFRPLLCFSPPSSLYISFYFIIAGSTWCRPATLNCGVQRIVLTWCQQRVPLTAIVCSTCNRLIGVLVFFSCLLPSSSLFFDLVSTLNFGVQRVIHNVELWCSTYRSLTLASVSSSLDCDRLCSTCNP